jgi:hypothetical protein
MFGFQPHYSSLKVGSIFAPGDTFSDEENEFMKTSANTPN